MIRAALCLLLGGCTVIEHIQLAPTFDKQNDPGCCVLYAEPSKNTVLSLTVTKPAETVQVKLGARLKF